MQDIDGLLTPETTLLDVITDPLAYPPLTLFDGKLGELAPAAPARAGDPTFP